MILIVSSPRDLHARHVAQRVQVLDRPVYFLDTSRFGNGTLIAHHLGGQKKTEVTTADGSVIPLQDVRTVWYRRPWSPAIAETVLDENDRRFSMQEWAQAIDGVLLSLNARFVNPLPAQRAAVKPRQLEIAQQVGMAIPENLTRNELSDFSYLWLVGVANNDGATRCRGLKSPAASIGGKGCGMQAI